MKLYISISEDFVRIGCGFGKIFYFESIDMIGSVDGYYSAIGLTQKFVEIYLPNTSSSMYLSLFNDHEFCTTNKNYYF